MLLGYMMLLTKSRHRVGICTSWEGELWEVVGNGMEKGRSARFCGFRWSSTTGNSRPAPAWRDSGHIRNDRTAARNKNWSFLLGPAAQNESKTNKQKQTNPNETKPKYPPDRPPPPEINVCGKGRPGRRRAGRALPLPGCSEVPAGHPRYAQRTLRFSRFPRVPPLPAGPKMAAGPAGAAFVARGAGRRRRVRAA